MIEKLKNIPQDKLLHFFYGTWISFICLLVFGLYGLIIPVVIAALKEVIYDKILGKGDCEIMDFVFTIIPTIMMYLIILNK